eukprot:6191860-Pleurochrysis_carterae.AAC.5
MVSLATSAAFAACDSSMTALRRQTGASGYHLNHITTPLKVDGLPECPRAMGYHSSLKQRWCDRPTSPIYMCVQARLLPLHFPKSALLFKSSFKGDKV